MSKLHRSQLFILASFCPYPSATFLCHDFPNLYRLLLITSLEVSHYHSCHPSLTASLLVQSISIPHIANDRSFLKDLVFPDGQTRLGNNNLYASMQSALNLPQYDALPWQQDK